MGMTGLLRWHWVEKIPWSRKWQPAPVFFPENFHGEGASGLQEWNWQDIDNGRLETISN